MQGLSRLDIFVKIKDEKFSKTKEPTDTQPVCNAVLFNDIATRFVMTGAKTIVIIRVAFHFQSEVDFNEVF